MVLEVALHGFEPFFLGVEDEDGALEVDEAVEFHGFFTGALVDVHGEFSHFGGGDLTQEAGIGDAEDDLADFPPFFDEIDMFDLAVGEVDGLHFAFSSGEDVAFEPPGEFDMIGEEAELAHDFLASERVAGGDLEADVDGVGEHVGGWLGR